MSEYVRITDVSPRDGLQNEAGIVPAAEKVALIRALAASGVDEVEATSFVSPRWVPQLGDASEVLSELRGSCPHPGPLPEGEGGGGEESAPPPKPVLSTLVPNQKGFDRLLEHHSEEFPLKVAVFTAASETFSQKNTNASIDETIERFQAFVPQALETGMDVRVYVSCVIACPYEGPIAPSAVREVCDRLRVLAHEDDWDCGQAELDLGDTIGAGDADSMRALLNEFDEDERFGLTLHLHDTFGRAAECVRVGLDMGVRSFDGSVAGLGGCPYAGTKEKPAPGNVSTELLVETAEDAGFETGVDREKLRKAAEVARRIVSDARAGTAS